jgi:hypothetical protein
MTDDADHKSDQPTVYRRPGSLPRAEKETLELWSDSKVRQVAQDKADLERLAIELGTWVEDSPRGRQCAEAAKANPIDGPTDLLLPTATKGLKKTDTGWLWPPPDHPQGKRALSWIVRDIIKNLEDGGMWEYAYNVMARDMLAHRRKPWSTAAFVQIYNEANDRLAEQEEFESKARNSTAGRKPTDKTGRIELIRETLQVSRSRAYSIDTDGTAAFEDRKKLAKAFNHDPARCFPGAWEMMFASRHGRPSGRPTLAQYVNSGAADFDNYPAFERLKAACGLGAIPDTFSGIDAFIDALLPAGIAADEALAIWRIGGPWREDH